MINDNEMTERTLRIRVDKLETERDYLIYAGTKIYSEFNNLIDEYNNCRDAVVRARQKLYLLQDFINDDEGVKRLNKSVKTRLLDLMREFHDVLVNF